MKFTATQIAAILEGKVEGNPNAEVWNVAKIEEGAPGMISFLANPKYTHFIYETQSSIVIVNQDFEATAPIQATLIRVPDAYASFAKLLSFYDQMMQNKQGVSSLAFVSSTAQCGENLYENLYLGEFVFVGENARIGNNVKLYPQVYVGDGCVISDNTVLYPGVKLYRNTVIGKNCILHAGAVLGADGFGFAPQADGHYEKIPQVGNVVVDDNVEIGRSTMGSTRVHKGVKLDNLIHLAHNVEVGENSALAAQVGVSGSTHLGKNCVVGGQSGFVGHITIADGSKFGGQSGIMGSIKEENQEFMGTPIQPLRKYLVSNARFRHIDEMARKLDALEKELAELKKQS